MLRELRALAYKLFSELLDYPYNISELEEKLRNLIEISQILEKSEFYEGLCEYIEDIVPIREIEKISDEEFQAEYVSTFELGYPKPKCPPYEREFIHTENELKFFDELTRYYLRYGLLVESESPDHIVVELEFMYYLIAKGETSAEIKFLEDHILRWIDSFLECVEKNCNLNFYSKIVRYINVFVKKDHRYLISSKRESEI